ncbi:hypothetical protein [uncultured Campylobacter sp.]|uniref:hypothetical protein n=1 Tax=uncultured Campylobacter sp. TaxID=218934 RepID=UPI00261A8E06|nr:hypothetical protein [uncultured Campylobacter sp.]
MLDRIAAFLTGIMCFLYLINFAVHKHVKIGEKYINFDDAGSLWILPAIAFIVIGISGFYFAFRSEKNIKRYPKYMWCKDCFKFYMYEDVKNTDQICPDCGKKLTEYNDGDYWRRNASDQSAKVPKIKKRKFKKR